MPPPQAIIFDLGKVLVDFDYSRAAKAIAARSAVTPETINALINQSPLLVQYELGKMTDKEFFDEVRSATGFKGDFEEFGQLFGDIFFEIPPMIELHDKLRKSGIPTYIFSNTNGLAVAHIRRTFPFFSQFDDYIFSFEHGAMKPEAGLYEVVERKSNRRGEQILYIDDRAENVAAGAARGWQTILQETPDKTIAAVKSTGLI